MNEAVKTGVYVVVAIGLLVIAKFVTDSGAVELDQFSDQGKAFYADFTDPLAASSLEVVQYDEESGTLHPFKVQVVDDLWSIPSHYDYPADGEDRLAQTAASFIDVKKDVVQSDRPQDHEALGVIDPLDDANPTLTGRGTRVTIRDASGDPLADYIIGKPVPERQGFRYVRLPEKKRTYAAKMDVDLSTRFADWINTTLLDIDSFNIKAMTIRDYTVDEQTGSVDTRGTVRMSKDEANQWTVADTPPEREVNLPAINQMANAISQLTITGVRPKPAGLSSDLSVGEGLQLDLADQLSLRSKGFFVSRDGALLSNEGEVSVGMTDGVRYTLRFGEVLVGEGLEISAGLGDDDAGANDDGEEAAADDTGENRYLFVTARFDESLLGPKPTPPAAEPDAADAESEDGTDDEAAEESDAEDAAAAAQAEYERALRDWESQAAAAQQKATQLNTRFAPWYYVISASDFAKIRVGLEDVTKVKE